MTVASSFGQHVQSILQRVQRRVSAVELVHVPYGHWPLPHARPTAKRNLRVSVLDSSFNPPTRAHLALARSGMPRDLLGVDADTAEGGDAYDARLLLLSVRNADKMLVPGDATLVQRVEMMVLLAKDAAQANTNDSQAEPRHAGILKIENVPSDAESAAHPNDNVAVALIDAPTFVAKSEALHTFFMERLMSLVLSHTHLSISSPIDSGSRVNEENVGLTFLLGLDTLTRLFAPRFYGNSEDKMQSALAALFAQSTAVCARRSGDTGEADGEERRTLALAQKWLKTRRLVLVDLGRDAWAVSSSAVRKGRREGNEDWMGMVSERVREYVESEGLYV